MENVGNLWEIHGKSIGNTKEKWKCMEKMEMYLDMGHISGTYFWDIYEKSMEYMGTYLGNLWKITCIYIYMWDILPVFIGYVGNLWEIYGKSMGNLWTWDICVGNI